MNALLLFCFCFAAGKGELQELLDDDQAVGMVLLREGFIGSLKDDRDATESSLDHFEFTHVLVARNNIDGTAQKTLVVGEKNSQPERFRATTLHLKDLPSLGTIKKLKNISDFESIFGKAEGPRTGIRFDGATRSTMGWMGFTLNKDGTLLVVSVFLHTIDRGDGERIDTKNIRTGIFRPTGLPPKLEDLTNQAMDTSRGSIDK